MSWSSRSCEALVFRNVYHAASSSPRVIIKSRASSIFVMSDHYLFVIAVTCHSHVVVVWHHMHHIAARYRVSGHMHGRHHGALVIIEIDLAVLVRFGRVYRPHMRLSTLTAVIGCQVHVPQSSSIHLDTQSAANRPRVLFPFGGDRVVLIRESFAESRSRVSRLFSQPLSACIDQLY